MIATNDPKDQGSLLPKTFSPFTVLPKKHTVKLLCLYQFKSKKPFVERAKGYLEINPELILRITEQGLDPTYFLYALEYVFSQIPHPMPE